MFTLRDIFGIGGPPVSTLVPPPKPTPEPVEGTDQHFIHAAAVEAGVKPDRAGAL